MSENEIKINDVVFYQQAGQHVPFPGKFFGKELAGIDLDFRVSGNENIARIEALFENKVVQVEDPFVNRTYKAHIRKVSESYQSGHPEHSYVGEIREVDVPPTVELLDINGQLFSVSRYSERDMGNDGIGRHALLKLSSEEFGAFRDMLKADSILVKRVGIDTEPLDAHLGGMLYWSVHNENGQVYYKQIVGIYPNTSSGSKLGQFFRTRFEVIEQMIFALNARFEALVDVLVANQAIDEPTRSKILGEEWKQLVDSSRMDRIILQAERVKDVDEIWTWEQADD